MRYLSILLLAPWLLVLCWIYWAYPRDLPANARRRSFDVLALLLTATATALAALAGFDTATLPQVEELGRPSGGIWQQVLPALYGYGAFTAVLLPALWLRQRCWGRRALAGAGESEARPESAPWRREVSAGRPCKST